MYNSGRILVGLDADSNGRIFLVFLSRDLFVIIPFSVLVIHLFISQLYIKSMLIY